MIELIAREITYVLNFIAMKVAYCSVMHVYFTYKVVSARFDTKLRREVISLKVKLLHLLCHVWCSMYSSAMHLLPGIPIVSCQVLMKILSCSQTYK